MTDDDNEVEVDEENEDDELREGREEGGKGVRASGGRFELAGKGKLETGEIVCVRGESDGKLTKSNRSSKYLTSFEQVDTKLAMSSAVALVALLTLTERLQKTGVNRQRLWKDGRRGDGKAESKKGQKGKETYHNAADRPRVMGRL